MGDQSVRHAQPLQGTASDLKAVYYIMTVSSEKFVHEIPQTSKIYNFIVLLTSSSNLFDYKVIS